MAKELKDPNAPKKPPTAYISYCNDKRKEDETIAKMTVGEQGRKLGQMWKSESADEKKKYEENYKKLMKKWESEDAAYKLTDSHKKFQEQKKARKEKEKEKADKQKVVPKRRQSAMAAKKLAKPKKVSAYNIFVREMYAAKKLKGEPVKFGGMSFGEDWKKLSLKDKEVYTKKAEVENKGKMEKKTVESTGD